jgi:BlaI family transcriptional regulator, penicillinase repressor
MPHVSQPPVSDAELAVLKTLWSQGPATVKQVQLRLPRRTKWAYNTVLTLLTRLRDKGCVAQDRAADAHVFRAAVSRDDLLGRRLQELADRLCDGAASPLVHALVDASHLTSDDIAQLRKKLDELEGRTKP